MKHILGTLLLPAAIVASFPTHADAAITILGFTISGFTMTRNSVTFQIRGEFPALVPPRSSNALYFTNPVILANPGFALSSDFRSAGSYSFTGSQPLRSSPVPVALGAPNFGDYFYVSFANPLAAGETIDGTLTASWTTDVFDPSAVTSLDVYWGGGTTVGLVNRGTLLTSTAVPEPSAAILIAGGLCLTFVRRRCH